MKKGADRFRPTLNLAGSLIVAVQFFASWIPICITLQPEYMFEPFGVAYFYFPRSLLAAVGAGAVLPSRLRPCRHRVSRCPLTLVKSTCPRAQRRMCKYKLRQRTASLGRARLRSRALH